MTLTRLRVRISLVDSEPEIWRLIDIDGGLDLESAHRVTQLAFGWRTEHLHKFSKNDPWARMTTVEIEAKDNGFVPLEWYDQESLDEGLAGRLETDATLSEILTESSPVAYYEYDFGDGWLHRLDLITAGEDGDGPARVLDGSRRGPLEDAGGVHGCHEKLDLYAIPTRPDPYDIRGWVDEIAGPWEVFDPAAFDIDHVNSELALLTADPGGPLESWQKIASRMLGSRGGEFRGVVRPLVQDVTLPAVSWSGRWVRPRRTPSRCSRWRSRGLQWVERTSTWTSSRTVSACWAGKRVTARGSVVTRFAGCFGTRAICARSWVSLSTAGASA